MTPLQTTITEKLLSGHTIAALTPRYIRLRDASGNPVRNLACRTFYALKPLLRKKGDLFLIDRNKVRALHGNSNTKRLYKGKKGEKAEIPPPHKRNRKGPPPDQSTLF